MTRNSEPKPVDITSELAFQRTRKAADRTLMAWMRTSTSMISFGFSIGKLFETLKLAPGSVQDVLHDTGPFAVGTLLIGLAIVFLIAALIEYSMNLRRLGSERGLAFRVSTAQIAASAMSLLGMVALANLLWRF